MSFNPINQSFINFTTDIVLHMLLRGKEYTLCKGGQKTLLGHVSISSHKRYALDFVVVFQKSVTEVFKVFLIFPHI